MFKDSLHPNAGRSLSEVDKIPVNNFERNNIANMTTRKQEFRSILRVLENSHIEKVPLACLLVVGTLFTNERLDLNTEFNSRFCFFRQKCCRRMLQQPPPLDLSFFDEGALAVFHMIALVVVLRLDRAAVISLNISVISSWITKKEEITY